MSEPLDPSLKSLAHPLHILIVEDIELMATAIRDRLEMLRLRFPDARLTCVSNFKDGIDVVSQIPHPDVVLLDIGLPDSAWETTIANVHEFENRSPVLIVTGHSEDTVRERLKRAGQPDIEVLRKDPSMWSKLIECVARAMMRAKHGNMERITQNIRTLREMIHNAPNE